MNPTVEMVLLGLPPLIAIGAGLLKLYRTLILNTEITKRIGGDVRSLSGRVGEIEKFIITARAAMHERGHKT